MATNYPWGSQPNATPGFFNTGISSQMAFPFFQLVPTELNGVYFQCVEISGDVWMVQNVTYNTAAIGGPAWQQNTQIGIAGINNANNAYAWKLTATGHVQHLVAGATHSDTTPVVWTVVWDVDSSGNETVSGNLTVDGNLTVVGTITSSVIPNTPGGRLSLSSNFTTPPGPVMAADVSNAGTIYYSNYINSALYLWNGSAWTLFNFTQLPLTLNSGQHTSGNLYDLFIFNNSGSPKLAAGPAWTNSTTRAAAISYLDGLWTNSATITLTAGGLSFPSQAANTCLYVGTFYANGNAQCTMQFTPNAASGGSNTILGLYNAYFQRHISSSSTDNNAGYTYAVAAWRPMDNNNNNRITVVDGLGQSHVRCAVSSLMAGSSANGQIGITVDSVSASPKHGIGPVTGTSGANFPTVALEIFQPAMGLHFYQAMEIANSGTVSFNNDANAALLLDMDM